MNSRLSFKSIAPFFNVCMTRILKSWFKIWHVVKFFTQFMLRPILSVSTTAALYVFQIKIWHVMEFSIRNHAFRKSTKNVKYVVFTSKTRQNVIFWMQTFFQNKTSWKTFKSLSNSLYFFQFKIWIVVRLSKQHLTRCKKFISKSDALANFFSKSDEM